MTSSSVRGAPAIRIAVALITPLGLWPACSSGNGPGGSSLSTAGSSGGSALGQAGICTAPASCGVGGAHGPDLVINDGGAAHQGGSAAAGAGLGTGGGASSLCQPPALVAPGCMAESDNGSEALCNGLDDDCDGKADEGCPCIPGDVQPCFLGPPARRGVGACVDGAQTCLRGGEFAPYWGDCVGGIRPSDEVCDGLDNDCNGCADDLVGCTAKWTCPGPNDPRTPDGVPLAPYLLEGHQFFSETAASWSWTIQGGPCDELNSPSFTLQGADSETATFTPKLSGDYTVTMTVTPVNGAPFTCSWIVHIAGPGLRIEMCYPESTTQDLDLYLKQPGHKTPWFTAGTQHSTALDQCSWANCEATLRPTEVMPAPAATVMRADWGYPHSPLSLCQHDLQGAVWQSIGYCSSPRLDIDNNLSQASGVPENINVDAPKENETFRIMVANFTGAQAHPLVNIYCDGRRVATIGAAPDALTSFSGTRGSEGIGALWRVADVTTHVSGSQTTCAVNVLHPPGTSTGFDVTVNDARY